jgi:hypothetical protein
MITDGKMDPRSFVARTPIPVHIVTAINQTNTVAASLIPGYRFEVVRVEVYASAVTAAVTADVRIGSTSVLTGAVTPVAGSVVEGTLVATRSGRRSVNLTDALNVVYTTNGSGAATNLRVTVWVRAYPCNGEA